MKLIFFILVIMCTSCTYSINMIHTQGTADDVIDENQTARPDISTTVTVPVNP